MSTARKGGLEGNYGKDSCLNGPTDVEKHKRTKHRAATGAETSKKNLERKIFPPKKKDGKDRLFPIIVSRWARTARTWARVLWDIHAQSRATLPNLKKAPIRDVANDDASVMLNSLA